MIESKAKKIFEKYNPASGVVRCPNGRAKMRKPLDTYAIAAVNLYGIIKRNELADIFNSQNDEQTSADEIYTLLLPNVLKSGRYGFYKDYIVHYAILRDFDWVDYLEKQQANKPRYIPKQEKFLRFENEWFEDSSHWQNVSGYMREIFGSGKGSTNGFLELKEYLLHNLGIRGIGEIMERHNLVFNGEKQAQKFFDLLMLAKNNTRMWENKGHTPDEIRNHFSGRQSNEPAIHIPKKVGPNQPCPCGSGKKYKKCCARIEESGAAQLSYDERKLFYETWYKLLDFVNKRLNVVNYKFSLFYSDYHDETLLHRIRERLWKKPKLISEFLASADNLSDEQISLLQAWEKRHVKGQFVLIKYEPSYAVLMRMDKNESCKLYGVKGMTTSIAESMRRQLPIMLETVLLPFGDKIIYDSFMASNNIGFGDGIRDMFEDEFIKAHSRFGIATKL